MIWNKWLAKRGPLSAGAARLRGAIANGLARGGWPTLAFFLAVGFVILCFLFLTVHNRSPSAYAAQHPEWTRCEAIIMTWIEEGPFKYGDFRLVTPFERGWTDSWGPMDPSKEYLYRSWPYGYLRPAYLLEFAHYKLWGRFSQPLMLIHNQALVWLSSAVLGFLVFLVAKDLELETVAAASLGIACQAAYQTFPFNLRFYWEIYHPTTMAVVLAWFLVVFYRLIGPGEDRRRQRPGPVAIGLPVFLMFYVDYISALFVVLAALVATRLLDRAAFERLHPWRSIVLPAALFFGLFLVERAVVGALYPDIEGVGSGFLARTGLDGSRELVADHWDLVSRRSSHLGRWQLVFLAGAASVAGVALMSLRWLAFRPAVTVMVVALAAYIPRAFVFMQETAIHPRVYDVYLAFPLIAALLGFLPACLERVSRRSGIFVVLAIAVAFSLSFVHLRLYAMAYPLPFETRWLPFR